MNPTRLFHQLCRRFTNTSRAFVAIAAGGMLAPQIQAAEIDLLVLYDSHSATYFNQQVETAMQNWVAQINNAYRDSQVDLQLRLVGVVPNEQTGADMNAVLTGLRQNSTATNLRTQYGADFVTQLHRTGRCGIAYFTVNRNWAWSVVGPDCGPLTLAHELGHNMGLAHSRKQGDTAGSRYAYGLGHGVDGLFGTIMSYSWLYTNRASGRVARFSNPNINCLGSPCGVPADQPDQADAVLAINNVKTELASFQPTVVRASSSSQVATSSSSSVPSSSASSAPRSSSSHSSSSSAQSSSAQSSSVVVSSSSSQSSVATGLAQCTYTIVNQGRTSFTADVRITNTSAQPINGWSVAWGYERNVWLAYASGASVSGRNPYTANSSATINSGQTAQVRVWGYKSRSEQLETPRVTGGICN